MKKIISLWIFLVSFQCNASLLIDAVLTINPGNVSNVNSTPVDGAGSWFSMEVKPGLLTHSSIEGLNHIQLGVPQFASVADPDIDKPWRFFGNLGVHQTTVAITTVMDDGVGNVKLDFNGWDISWNGINSIQMNTGLDNGIATMVCANDCSAGDTYILSYRASFPAGDPSGFGNVKYILHLEGVIKDALPTTGVAIDLLGGTTHECSLAGGSSVNAEAKIQTSDTDDIVSINWSLDGTDIGSGAYIDIFASLGGHELTVVINTLKSGVFQNTVPLSITDNTAPDLSIRLIDERNGEEVTEVSRNGIKSITVYYDVNDICDSAPTVTGVSFPASIANQGDTVIIKKQLTTSAVNFSAKAIDASGNHSHSESMLKIGH